MCVEVALCEHPLVGPPKIHELLVRHQAKLGHEYNDSLRQGNLFHVRMEYHIRT